MDIIFLYSSILFLVIVFFGTHGNERRIVMGAGQRDLIKIWFQCECDIGCFQTCNEVHTVSSYISGGAVCENTNVRKLLLQTFPKLVGFVFDKILHHHHANIELDVLQSNNKWINRRYNSLPLKMKFLHNGTAHREQRSTHKFTYCIYVKSEAAVHWHAGTLCWSAFFGRVLTRLKTNICVSGTGAADFIKKQNKNKAKFWECSLQLFESVRDLEGKRWSFTERLCIGLDCQPFVVWRHDEDDCLYQEEKQSQ